MSVYIQQGLSTVATITNPQLKQYAITYPDTLCSQIKYNHTINAQTLD